MRPHADGAARIQGGRWRTAGRHVVTLALTACAAISVVSTAGAQTVVVTNAPAGTRVDVVRDATMVGSAPAGDDGVARIAIPDTAKLQQDIDGLLFVDVCPDRRRVIILERHRQVAPIEANCTREEIPGLFLVRAVSTLAIDVGVTPPRLLLRQRQFDPTKPARVWAEVPLGLALSGGVGLGSFSAPKTNACGTVTACSDSGMGTAVTGGVAYWFLRYLGAEIGYVRPREWKAEGSGDDFRFASTLDAEVLTASALVGGPAGPTRLYGKVGGGYHRATFSTTQTIDETTVTVDDQPAFVRGGSYASGYKTQGWGWSFGGGFELWMSRHVAAYADLNITRLRGGDPDGGEGIATGRLTTIIGGVKVHLGR